jgi:SAM-dependent methyltransferase
MFGTSRPPIAFAVRVLLPEVVEGKLILEVGSSSIQGTARDHVAPHAAGYVGVDIVGGPGVDVICPVEDLAARFEDASFDVVLATEVLEHIRDWRLAIRNMTQVLRLGGLMVITTRSIGYPYHGVPHDYWRYEAEDVRQIFEGWRVEALEHDPDRPGVFAALRKTASSPPRLDSIALHSIALGRRAIDVSTARVLLHRISSPRQCRGVVAARAGKAPVAPPANALWLLDRLPRAGRDGSPERVSEASRRPINAASASARSPSTIRRRGSSTG